jgi:hypothetical protein
MAYFKRTRFSGIAPGVAPRLLAEQFGQEAENLDFESGEFAPIPIEGSTAHVLSNSQRRSIYYYDNSTSPMWVEWDEDGVKAVEGPIPGDADDRLYWTGEDYPRMGTYTGLSNWANRADYRLGIPAPQAAPSITINGTLDASVTAEETAWVYTFVSEFGEEGPPSEASTIYEFTPSTQTATVNIPSYNVAGDYAFGSPAKKRIYRANVGSNATDFQFVAEVLYSVTQYSDSKEATELGEVIPSTTWIGPPDDDTTNYPDGPLQGLTPVANGIFAGFTGKRLCLSEAYLPHAWPVDYRITLENDIVAIGTTANGIVALTDGKPYFVTGVDPSAMSAVQINLEQGCVNPRSVVDLGDVVLYAGPDGLCAISGTEGRVITRGLISPTQWNDDFYPEQIRAFEHEGTYVAFYTDTFTNTHAGWVYDPRAEEAALSTITTSAERRGGYKNPKTGELFLIIGTAVQPYRGSTTFNRLGRWKSKKYVTPAPVSMGWVSLKAELYPSTGTKNRVLVWADGTLIADYFITFDSNTNTYTQEVNTPSGISDTTLYEPIMRLPAVVGSEWEVEIRGSERIHEFCLAQSMDEIRQS